MDLKTTLQTKRNSESDHPGSEQVERPNALNMYVAYKSTKKKKMGGEKRGGGRLVQIDQVSIVRLAKTKKKQNKKSGHQIQKSEDRI